MKPASPFLLALVLLGFPQWVAAQRVVSRSEMLQAMRACQGYDPTATTNGARFQAEVLLRLLRESPAEPGGRLLFLDHADWYEAFLERTGRSRADAPLFARLAYEHHQDLEVDARPGSVIERVVEGPEPRLAANVRLGWPRSPDRPDSYSYDDTLAVPDLRVTNERVIAYRLVDYGDLIAFEEIEGLRGRPTEGLLGLLFNLIGEGSVRWNRMTLSPDGLQVSRARATKGPFHVESTITVFPDGRVEKDLPKDRADLEALEQRLLEKRSLRYRPLDAQRAPVAPAARPPALPATSGAGRS